MSNYIKTTNFATKFNIANPTFTGTVTALVVAGNLTDNTMIRGAY
tara:strand:+ start:252 stop:386 length:135 start_codon:yes stop_codon:yes gene_type:complete